MATKRRRDRGLRLLVAAAALALSSPLARAAAPRFSDFVFTYRKLSSYVWDPFARDFPVVYAANGNVVPAGAGEVTYFLRPADGKPDATLYTASRAQADGLSRQVEFRLRDWAGTERIGFEILERGRGLRELPLTDLRAAKLPFFPTPGVDGDPRDLEIRAVIFGRPTYQITISRDPGGEGRLETLRAEMRGGFAGPAFEYEEVAGPETRSLRWTFYLVTIFEGEGDPRRFLKKGVIPRTLSFSVRATQRAGDILPSEEYFIDDTPVSVREYQTLFGSVIIQSWVNPQWRSVYDRTSQWILNREFDPLGRS